MTKQKFFLTYRPPKKRTSELKNDLDAICSTLKNNNHKVYCPYEHKAYYFDEAGMSPKQVKTFIDNKREQTNHTLLFIRNNYASKQLHLDLQKAKKLGHKTTLLAPTYQTTTHFVEEVDQILLYDTVDDLCKTLEMVF